MDVNDIRRKLEAEYDIPFVVTNAMENGEPCYVIGPRNSGKELFTVKVSFRNKVRLSMEFQPEKYSAQFIRSMAVQSEENKHRFISYYSLLKQMGAKSDVQVNGNTIDEYVIEHWPDEWKSFQIRVTKMPVFENGEDYPEEAYKWGSMLVGMILSLADIVPVEEDVPVTRKGYTEGDIQRVETNRYERNPLNRKLCLAAKGFDCIVCGMNFEKKYGRIGRQFIHVHHVVPVSKLGPGYVIDPIKDLVPVCPNCHAMLHRSDPPLLPEVLKEIMEQNG